MSKIAIFASGTGTNAARITEYFLQNNQSIHIDCFITNKANAGVYKVAERFDVPIFQFENSDFVKGDKLVNFLKERNISWIVLAGFLRKIAPTLIQNFNNKIINIHPSLLPNYGGKGMYGKYVHQAVLKNEESESGISIHLVNEAFDEGEILFQKSCSIEEGETVESLAKKIQQLEHHYFPKVIEERVEAFLKEEK